MRLTQLEMLHAAGTCVPHASSIHHGSCCSFMAAASSSCPLLQHRCRPHLHRDGALEHPQAVRFKQMDLKRCRQRALAAGLPPPDLSRYEASSYLVATGGGGGNGASYPRPLCHYFQQGTCRWGDARQYSHDAAATSEAVQAAHQRLLDQVLPAGAPAPPRRIASDSCRKMHLLFTSN